MRYVFGTLALAAAIVIVGYSATTLFAAAFNASAEPWQQYLNGTGAAAIVLWEATALILIGAAWHRGYKPVAVLSALLLVVAMLVTLTWEMGNVIGGQADKLAARAIDTKKQEDIDKDLKWLRDRRDQLTNKASSKAVRDEMEWIANRIEGLEKDRSAAKAVGEASPRAAWAARVIGGTEQRWSDILNALPLLFWMLARVTAAPLAVAAMVGVKREDRQEARTAPEAVPATLTPKTVVSPLADAIRDSERDLIAEEVLRLRDMPVTPQLTKVVTPPEDPDPKGGRGPILPPSAEVGQPAKEASGPEPLKQAPAARLVVDNDLPEFITKGSKGFKKKEKRLEGNVIRWIAECTSQTPDKRVKATSQECRRSYVAWCKVNGFEEIGHKKMSRIMSAELRRGDQAGRGPRNGKGAVFPGLVVYQPAAEPLRRRA